MWKKESRARYDRSALRYPSHLTDGELAILALLIPPAKRGGRPREVDIRAVIGGLLYVLKLATPGGSCPRILRPRARCTAISSCGPRTVRWSVFTTPCMSRCASGKATRPARRPQFSRIRPFSTAIVTETPSINRYQNLTPSRASPHSLAPR